MIHLVHHSRQIFLGYRGEHCFTQRYIRDVRIQDQPADFAQLNRCCIKILDSTKPGPLASVLCFRKDISNYDIEQIESIILGGRL